MRYSPTARYKKSCTQWNIRIIKPGWLVMTGSRCFSFSSSCENNICNQRRLPTRQLSRWLVDPGWTWVFWWKTTRIIWRRFHKLIKFRIRTSFTRMTSWFMGDKWARLILVGVVNCAYLQRTETLPGLFFLVGASTNSPGVRVIVIFWGHLEKTIPWRNANDLVRFPLSFHVSYDKNTSLFECI